jgi:hypothetical protein
MGGTKMSEFLPQKGIFAANIIIAKIFADKKFCDNNISTPWFPSGF